MAGGCGGWSCCALHAAGFHVVFLVFLGFCLVEAVGMVEDCWWEGCIGGSAGAAMLEGVLRGLLGELLAGD